MKSFSILSDSSVILTEDCGWDYFKMQALALDNVNEYQDLSALDTTPPRKWPQDIHW